MIKLELTKEKVKIAVSTDKGTYFYTGIIKDDDGEFITLDDNKVGEIKLNKSRIFSIQPIGGRF